VRIATENPAVYLRDWAESDCDSLVRHANNRLVWRNLLDTFPHPYTRADAEQWVHIVATRPGDVLLAIELAGEAIGGIGCNGKAGNYRHTANFGYWLGQTHWGKGIATAAARALKAHALANSRFVRLEAPVFEWNPASMRVLEKAGFMREGILRKSALKDGELIDQVMYAAVRTSV
jgi:RimJ/RimL family protein N-acetyltransferase